MKKIALPGDSWYRKWDNTSVVKIIISSESDRGRCLNVWNSRYASVIKDLEFDTYSMLYINTYDVTSIE